MLSEYVHCSRIVTLGPAGVGKSTLVNTLIMRPECVEGSGGKSVTSNLEARVVDLPLRHGKGIAMLIVYDCPGFTGDDDEDDETIRQLRTIGSVDLLLICFDLTSDGCRYTPMRQGFILKKAVEAMGEQVVQEKAVIVLTKANTIADLREDQADGRELPGVEDFRKEHKRHCEKLRKSLRFLGDLDILVAGRLEFSATGKPNNITNVNGSKEWLSGLYNAAGVRASDAVCKLLLEETISTAQAEKEQRVSQSWCQIQ